VSETGAVKFQAERSAATLEPFPGLAELNNYRTKLRQLGLLGVDANGIGFGNISMRDGTSTRFYITGSDSGAKTELTLSDCTRVLAGDLARNWLLFEGAAMASSESLTHAALYEADDSIGAIMHGHSLSLWKTLLEQGLMTPASVEYGTPAMARAVRSLLEKTNVRETKAFAMAGHAEGVIAFGANLGDAYNVLLEVIEERRS
jgi:ribulose-5-phosphate 4-epimerase/fuculose-1-phosphate aldolase